MSKISDNLLLLLPIFFCANKRVYEFLRWFNKKAIIIIIIIVDLGIISIKLNAPIRPIMSAIVDIIINLVKSVVFKFSIIISI